MNDNAHGHGVLTNRNQCRYTGQFMNNKMHGQG